MVGLAAFGAMNAVLGSGGRIVAERAVGWNRQLRPTPLSTRRFPITASHFGLGRQGWGTTGWIVVAAWTVGAALLARHAYARDTQRV